MDQVIEGVLTIIKGFDPRKRRIFFKKLVGSGLLTEDEQDILIIESRRGGPTRPIEEVAERIRRKTGR